MGVLGCGAPSIPAPAGGSNLIYAPKPQHAVRLGILDLWRLARLLQLKMVGVVVEGPGRLAAQHEGVERRVRNASPQAATERRPDVADVVQLLPYPAPLQPLGIGRHLRFRSFGRQVV